MGTSALALVRPTDASQRDGSLVSALAAGGEGIDFAMLPVAEIAEHPSNPRTALRNLEGLSASIASLGLRQPIVVVDVETFHDKNPDVQVPTTARWVVTAGHRRRAATELAGIETIPAWIRPDLASIEAAAETFAVENIHRAPLEPIEEARAFALLVDLGRTQREIAERLGVSQSHVSKRLSLLDLPQPAQDALAAGELTVGDARALAELAPAADQLEIFEHARRHRLPMVSAAKQIARSRSSQEAKEQARQRAAKEKVDYVDDPAGAGLTEAHRLVDKASVAKARKAHTLVAGPDPEGTFTYFTTATSTAVGGDTRGRSSRRGQDPAHLVAAQARGRAAGEWVRTKPTAREVTDTLTDAVLFDRISYTPALHLAHEWLGDSVGITTADATAWRDSVGECTPPARRWVAWAIALAAIEVQTADPQLPWTARTRDYISALNEHAGYSPTAWEQTRLDAIAAERDSAGITRSHTRGGTA